MEDAVYALEGGSDVVGLLLPADLDDQLPQEPEHLGQNVENAGGQADPAEPELIEKELQLVRKVGGGSEARTSRQGL